MRKRKTENDTRYWTWVWLKALDNMPVKPTIIKDHFHYKKLDNVNIDEFIRRRAKKTIEQRKDGSYWSKTPHILPVGKLMLLTVLMGDIDGHGRERINRALFQGHAPKKGSIRHKRLLALADHGREIAWAYLKECGKDHLYVDKFEQEE